MKPIRIHSSNAEAVEAALREVNGTAAAHTFTSFAEVEGHAEQAEATLASFIPKKDFPGARYAKTSGFSVAKSYRGQRIATSIELERKSSAWYLVQVAQTMLYTEGGGPGRLILTEAQDAKAKERFSKRYGVRRGAA